MKPKIRTIFFGTPDIAAKTLQTIIHDDRYEVVGVVSQPDKPFGRKRIISPTPVKQIALDNDIPVFQPERIKKNQDFLDSLRELRADIFLVIAYGKIVPKVLLDIPKQGCINIHGSLLPKYRGAAPIQYALIGGETKTGATLMYMDETMDTGDIIDTLEIEIDTLETSATLFQKFAERCGGFAADGIYTQVHGTPTRTPQKHDQATYTGMIQKSDGQLDIQDSAKISYQKWQGYTPWPGLYFPYNDKIIQIQSCFPLSFQYKQEGIVISRISVDELNAKDKESIQKHFSDIHDIYILPHKQGSLAILQVKPEGKSSMSTHAWMNGQNTPNT